MFKPYFYFKGATSSCGDTLSVDLGAGNTCAHFGEDYGCCKYKWTTYYFPRLWPTNMQDDNFDSFACVGKRRVSASLGDVSKGGALYGEPTEGFFL